MARSFATSALATSLAFLIETTTLLDILHDCTSLRQRPFLRAHVLLGSGYHRQCFLRLSALVVLQALQVEFVVLLVGLVAEVRLVVRSVRELLVLGLLFVFDIVEDPERSPLAWLMGKHVSFTILRVVLL